jgi:hypothetical protein
VPLTDEVMGSLHRSDADDLLVTDGEGRPIPFQRLPERFLTENLSRRQRLSLRASPVDTEQPKRPGLELELTHRDTRLVVHPPAIEQRLGDRDRLVFEALIAGASAPPGMDAHRLRLELLSPSDLRLDCRLRDAADDGPASRRVHLNEFGDSRPRRFLAGVELDTLPPAWHLACYGRAAVPELDLTDAWLVSEGERRHRAVEQLAPALAADPEHAGAYEFSLDGPYRVRALALEVGAPNIVSSVRVLSRGRADRPWQARGALTLSTLPEARQARLEVDPAKRHRFWRLISEPALRDAPGLRLETPVEELVFLAQGPSPWKLYAGSRQAVGSTAGVSLLDNAVGALGPAWQWPELAPQARAEAAGPEVLEPPVEPTDWRRLGLWLVLIAGAVLVAGLALRLLLGRA